MICQQHKREMLQATYRPTICGWCLCGCRSTIFEHHHANRQTCGMGCWLNKYHIQAYLKKLENNL